MIPESNCSFHGGQQKANAVEAPVAEKVARLMTPCWKGQHAENAMNSSILLGER